MARDGWMKEVRFLRTQWSNMVNQANIWEKSLLNREESLARRSMWLELKQPWNSVQKGFPGGSVVKNPPANARDTGSITELGGSPGEGNGNPLQYLAWEVPWTEEPGRLQSMGLPRVGHDLVTKQQEFRKGNQRSHWEFWAIVRSWVIQSKLGVTSLFGRGVMWSDQCLEVSL